MRRLSGVFFAAMLCGSLASVYGQARRPTVLDGVYTAAQAERGEAAYGEHCAMCHEGADVDGPKLFGQPFLDDWREDTLDTLFTFIRTRMPRDAQGSLTEGMYLDILAHILQINEIPAGGKDLTVDTVKATQLVAPGGARPLPSNTTVQVVGCVSSGANNAWALTHASEPARTKSGDESTPEELKNAEAQAVAGQSFKLQNVGDLNGFNPDAAKGHKALVKGNLIWQPNNDRINVTLLKPLADTCTP